MVIIERGIKNRKTESEVFRFPNQLCTDKGRAINQQELGWEETLTGEPKEMYEFWHKHLRPRGYKLKVQIVDFPEGLPTVRREQVVEFLKQAEALMDKIAA